RAGSDGGAARGLAAGPAADGSGRRTGPGRTAARNARAASGHERPRHGGAARYDPGLARTVAAVRGPAIGVARRVERRAGGDARRPGKAAGAARSALGTALGRGAGFARRRRAAAPATAAVPRRAAD